MRDSFYPLNSNACLHLAIVLLKENKKSKQNFEDQRFFLYLKNMHVLKIGPSFSEKVLQGIPQRADIARATRLQSAAVLWPIDSACRQLLQEPGTGNASSSEDP